jgi:hypothetical protein
MDSPILKDLYKEIKKNTSNLDFETYNSIYSQFSEEQKRNLLDKILAEKTSEIQDVIESFFDSFMNGDSSSVELSVSTEEEIEMSSISVIYSPASQPDSSISLNLPDGWQMTESSSYPDKSYRYLAKYEGPENLEDEAKEAINEYFSALLQAKFMKRYKFI